MAVTFVYSSLSGKSQDFYQHIQILKALGHLTISISEIIFELCSFGLFNSFNFYHKPLIYTLYPKAFGPMMFTHKAVTHNISVQT